jgi:hypothetical protein
MKNLICPISTQKANENVVRITASMIILLTALFIAIPNPFIPVYLAFDFYIRAFTKQKYSPLSWLSSGIARSMKLTPIMIDKAPKIFAARIGFLFAIFIFALTLLNMSLGATILASTLILFAFLECGLNFCAGCWVYTYIVLPIYKDK